jgi:predicted MPP superfamily phosphohydrolase
VLLGDFVQGMGTGSEVPPEEMAAELGALRARRGVLAVLGNHDWWLDGERVRAALTTAGIRVLENEAVSVDVGGQPLWVAGLADLWTRQPDLRAALSKVPRGAPTLLLTHNPDVFPDVPPEVALTLAGHTHGGQVDVPLLGPLVVPSRFGRRYARGLVVEDGRMLFVTSGVATSVLPVRFRVPPEIAVLALGSR